MLVLCVAFQAVDVSEGIAAVCADTTIFSVRVHSFMTLKSILMQKGLSTCLANKLALPIVYHLVSLEISSVVKALFADRAVILALPCMQLFMSSEGSTVSKKLVAKLALELPCSCMDLQMSLQLPHNWKPLLANNTFIIPLSRVCLEMDSIGAIMCECSLTLQALVRALAGMCAFMRV